MEINEISQQYKKKKIEIEKTTKVRSLKNKNT